MMLMICNPLSLQRGDSRMSNNNDNNNNNDKAVQIL